VSFLHSYKLGRARRDLAAFAVLVMTDETTGAPIRSLAPHQRSMIRRWSKLDRSVSLASSGMGKSILMACFIAWRIGRNPSTRAAILSGTLAQAQKLMRLVQIVMRHPAYLGVFPHAVIDRSTLDELSVASRPKTQKDVNVIAGAYDLSSMLGSRIDLACCDDVATLDGVRTAAARDVAFQAFLAVTSSRIEPGGQIHVINTAMHSDDLPHRLGRLPGWDLQRYPAADEHGNPTFPERWSVEKIEATRLLGPVVYAREVLCVPVDASTLVFTTEQIDRALLNGKTAHITPVGGRVIIGVDPAWTTGIQSDLSGIVMVVIDSSGYRHVTHVEASKMNTDDLADRVVALARANKATVYCESNGAGGVIAGLIGRRVPCKPLVTTATSKRARVEALSAELASGKWALSQPLGTPSAELKKLVDDLEVFSFESHCGDRLSALLMACEGARLFESKPKGGWRQMPPGWGCR
jgi:phage terminase large subunit-like protein